MSLTGMHNGRKATADAMVRGLVMERDLPKFVEDEGRLPLTEAEAYEAGLQGGWIILGKGRNWRWKAQYTMPAVGLECLGALARGTAERENRVEDVWTDFDAYADSGFVECEGPHELVFWAFVEAEWERSRQIEAAWHLRDCGFVAAEDMPVFLRRVTAYEDALEMSRRIRDAEFELDLRAAEKASACLGGGR